MILGVICLSFTVRVILAFLTTFLTRKLLIVDYYTEGFGIYIGIFIFWLFGYSILFGKSYIQKEYEDDMWDYIRLTEGRKDWERHFNSEVKGRVTGKPWFRIL